MIPKKIHYFWLGGNKKTVLTNICINSWVERLNEYEIIEWNEDNLNLDEICNKNKFFRECRKYKLWAFMVDYLRLMVLYEHGGIYMDTDVQIIKSLTPLLENKGFLGKEADDYIGTGLIACEPGNKTIKKILEFYDDMIWNSDLYTIPTIITDIFNKSGSGEMKIYPMEYFSPYDYRCSFDNSLIKDNTYAIHWFNGSWTQNIHISTFMQTKHINNKIKKTIIIIKKTIGFYYRKFIKK